MIFEAMISGLMVVGAVYYRSTMDSRFLKPYKTKWNSLMEELNISSSGSKSSFKINSIEEITNGFIATVSIPPGLNSDILEKNIKSIENYYKAKVFIKNIEFTNMCNVKIIDTKLENYPFEPVKLKEYQLFIGKTCDGKDYILDMNKNSHVLLLGVTGSGKTMELMMILTNLIYNSSKKIEIHLSQIAKSETGMLKDCSCVKFYSTKLEDVALDLERVAKLIDYRSKIFDKEGVPNIKEYNKYNPKNKMKRIYYVIEELSFFMPQASDSDDIKYLKNKCWTSILSIVKAGRSVGIHFLSVSQRSTATNLPSDVKSQLTRISFNQISKVDSKNAIECDDACSLEEKQCLIYGDSRAMEIITVPLLKDGYLSLHEFVNEIKIPKKLLEEKNQLKVKNNENESINAVYSNDKIEKIFYEDRKVDTEELKSYLDNSDIKIKNNSSVENNRLIRNNKSKRAGVIKGGGVNVNNKG